MSKTASELQRAFLTKEEIERLLANLEELNSAGSITAEQYTYIIKDYNERLSAANSAIAQFRVELKNQLDDSRTSLGNNRVELDRLELRFRVGELPLENYERLERKLQRRVDRIQGEITELERFLEANSSGDMGTLSSGSRRVRGGTSEFSMPEASSFTEFVGSVAEVADPRTKLLGLVGGVFLFISVFMPWVSLGVPGFRLNFLAGDLSGHLVAAGVMCGLLAVGASFLARSDTRGLVHIAVGAIALIVVLIVGLSIRSFLQSLAESMGGWGRGIWEITRGMIDTREGLVFYIMAAIALICGGVLERREA